MLVANFEKNPFKVPRPRLVGVVHVSENTVINFYHIKNLTSAAKLQPMWHVDQKPLAYVDNYNGSVWCFIYVLAGTCEQFTPLNNAIDFPKSFNFFSGQ